MTVDTKQQEEQIQLFFASVKTWLRSMKRKSIDDGGAIECNIAAIDAFAKNPEKYASIDAREEAKICFTSDGFITAKGTPNANTMVWVAFDNVLLAIDNFYGAKKMLDGGYNDANKNMQVASQRLQNLLDKWYVAIKLSSGRGVDVFGLVRDCWCEIRDYYRIGSKKR